MTTNTALPTYTAIVQLGGTYEDYDEKAAVASPRFIGIGASGEQAKEFAHMEAGGLDKIVGALLNTNPPDERIEFGNYWCRATPEVFDRLYQTDRPWDAVEVKPGVFCTPQQAAALAPDFRVTDVGTWA